MNKKELATITKIIEKNNSKIKLLNLQLDLLITETNGFLSLLPITQLNTSKEVASSGVLSLPELPLESSDTNTAIQY